MVETITSEGAPMTMIKTTRYPSGDVYIGELLADEPHGYGIFKSANGNVVYDGEWFKGKRHGVGIIKWADGEVHNGEWSAGEQHGYGKMKLNDGSEYIGEFKNDKAQRAFSRVQTATSFTMESGRPVSGMGMAK
jgi:hypothetical protein